jgi:hypothetical protein
MPISEILAKITAVHSFETALYPSTIGIIYDALYHPGKEIAI